MAYSIHCRKRTTSKSQPVTQAAELLEEVVLDENEVAKGLEYCVVEECEPSPSHNLLAYSLDTTGYETYEVSTYPWSYPWSYPWPWFLPRLDRGRHCQHFHYHYHYHLHQHQHQHQH